MGGRRGGSPGRQLVRFTAGLITVAALSCDPPMEPQQQGGVPVFTAASHGSPTAHGAAESE